MKKLTDAQVVAKWKKLVVANGEKLDAEADKDGHDWHSLWTGFVIGLGRADLTDWSTYMRLSE